MTGNCPKTIAMLFWSLQDKTKRTIDYSLMERHLTISSVDPWLMESIEHLPDALDFAWSFSAKTVTDQCIICYEDALSGWESALNCSLPKRKRMHDGSLGMILVYEATDGIIIRQPDIGMVMIAESGEILCVVTQKMTENPSGAYLNLSGLLQAIFLEVLARGGWTVVHAGGAGMEGRCHLWTGPSGSGKTTRILELASKGWQFYGDDLVLLRCNQNQDWEVWPLSKKIKASIQTCLRIPHLRDYAAIATPSGEHTLLADKIFPLSRPDASILDTIYYMTLDAAPYRNRLKTLEAIGHLGSCFLNYTSTLYAEKSIDTLSDIVSKVPVYAISRGWLNAETRQSGNSI